MLFLLTLLVVACLGCEIDLSEQRLTHRTLQSAFNAASVRTGCPANQVTDLDLSENRLKSIPAGFFAQFPNLVDLDLEHNKLASLPIGVFNSLSNLKYLELDNNRFSSLRLGVFAGLVSLEELDLESCYLRTLPLGVFANLPRLRYVDMENNRIATLPLGLFDQNPALEELDLEENFMRSIPLALFMSNPVLSDLDISENRFRSQPALVFHPNAAPTITVSFEPQRRGREGELWEEWAEGDEEEVSGGETVGLAVAITLPALAITAFCCWRKARGTPGTDSQSTQATKYTELREAQGGEMLGSSLLLDADHTQEEAQHAIDQTVLV